MLALMPRCSACVLCGKAIHGRGRIDRIYCSASCRTLAWRARCGDRWAGRRKSRPPQPGSYVARSALPLLAVHMKAELEAAKQRIEELEAQLGGDDAPMGTVAGVGVTAAGAVGLLVALKKRLGRKHQAELARVQAALEAEQKRQQAELAAEREQAALRQAEQERQASMLKQEADQASLRQHATQTVISELKQTVEELHRQHQEDAEQLWRNTWELARLRRDVAQVRAERQAHQNALLEESHLRESLQVQLATTQRQLTATAAEWQMAYGQLEVEAQRLARQQLSTESVNWQTAYGQLEGEAQELARQLDAGSQEHQRQLSAMKSRAAKAETALASLRSEVRQQEREHRAQLEETQMTAARLELESPRERRNAPAALPVKSRKKPLPVEKKGAKKKLPAKKGTVETMLIAAAGAAAGAFAAVHGSSLLGDGDKKRLPLKEVGTYFEVTRVEERKRLPPKPD